MAKRIMDALNFQSILGKTITIFSKALDSELAPISATVHGAEAGGIWIESQKLTDDVLKALGQQMFEATPIIFLPFAQISWVIVLGDVPSISSKTVAPE
jgi:hypothetical protein